MTLKPCPFCGGTRYKHEKDCFLEMLSLYKWGDFDKAWNTRAERTCTIERKCSEPIGGLQAVWEVCSLCGEKLYGYENYCPNCGAKVIGG